MAPATSKIDVESVAATTTQDHPLPPPPACFASSPETHGLHRSGPKSLDEPTLFLALINSVASRLQKLSVSEQLVPTEGPSSTTEGSVQTATPIQTTNSIASKDSVQHKLALRTQSNRLGSYSNRVRGGLKKAIRKYGDRVQKKKACGAPFTTHTDSLQPSQCSLVKDEDPDVDPIVQALGGLSIADDLEVNQATVGPKFHGMFTVELWRSVAAVDPTYARPSLPSFTSVFDVAATRADATTEAMDEDGSPEEPPSPKSPVATEVQSFAQSPFSSLPTSTSSAIATAETTTAIMDEEVPLQGSLCPMSSVTTVQDSGLATPPSDTTLVPNSPQSPLQQCMDCEEDWSVTEPKDAAMTEEEHGSNDAKSVPQAQTEESNMEVDHAPTGDSSPESNSPTVFPKALNSEVIMKDAIGSQSFNPPSALAEYVFPSLIASVQSLTRDSVSRLSVVPTTRPTPSNPIPVAQATNTLRGADDHKNLGPGFDAGQAPVPAITSDVQTLKREKQSVHPPPGALTELSLAPTTQPTTCHPFLVAQPTNTLRGADDLGSGFDAGRVPVPATTSDVQTLKREKHSAHPLPGALAELSVVPTPQPTPPHPIPVAQPTNTLLGADSQKSLEPGLDAGRVLVPATTSDDQALKREKHSAHPIRASSGNGATESDPPLEGDSTKELDARKRQVAFIEPPQPAPTAVPIAQPITIPPTASNGPSNGSSTGPSHRQGSASNAHATRIHQIQAKLRKAPPAPKPSRSPVNDEEAEADAFLAKYNLGSRRTLVKPQPKKPSPTPASEPKKSKGDASRSLMDDLMAGFTSLVKHKPSPNPTPAAVPPQVQPRPATPNVPSAILEAAHSQKRPSHIVAGRQANPPSTLPNHVGNRAEVVASQGSAIPSRAPSNASINGEATGRMANHSTLLGTPSGRQAGPSFTPPNHVQARFEVLAPRGSAIPSTGAPSSVAMDGSANGPMANHSTPSGAPSGVALDGVENRQRAVKGSRRVAKAMARTGLTWQIVQEKARKVQSALDWDHQKRSLTSTSPAVPFMNTGDDEVTDEDLYKALTESP
ncbi:hypothetical protein FRC04_007039 [Tulasnella sp. 424]|nr:hypothetical protein FRC04_007039 [Tulasnella sp. 424]